MVTAGFDAEEAVRLHEDHHQQKRPAEVRWTRLSLSTPPVFACSRERRRRLSPQRILRAERADDGGGGGRHRWAARRAERDRRQPVYEGGGPGLSGALTFTRAAVLGIKTPNESSSVVALMVGLLASAGRCD